VEEAKDFPIVGTFVLYKDTRMMVFRIDVISKHIFLSNEDGAIQDIDLEQYSKLEVISIP